MRREIFIAVVTSERLLPLRARLLERALALQAKTACRPWSRTDLHASLAHPTQGARFRLFAEVLAPGVTLLPEAARLAR